MAGMTALFFSTNAMSNDLSSEPVTFHHKLHEKFSYFIEDQESVIKLIKQVKAAAIKLQVFSSLLF